jgi:CheY-like chemotaxis protein
MHACPVDDDLAPGTSISILVVEDEVLIRMMLADELRSAGFQVIEAAHADEALNVLKALARVDVLLTDIAMPLGSMDGMRLAALVRATWPNVKIIVASAYTPTRADALDAFIAKPVDPDRLVKRIRRLLAGPDLGSG